MANISQSRLHDHALACLIAGLIGDAMGTPTENMDYRAIIDTFGWVDSFEGDGTDDTIMKHLLAQSLIKTRGQATLDDWAQVWLEGWQDIFGSKVNKFFVSVLHTAQKLRSHSVPRMAALGNMPSSSSAMCIAPVGIVNACDPAGAARQAYNLAGLIHIHDVGFCQDAAAALAHEADGYEAFREQLYAQADTHFCRITCDSRETLPLTLALFYIAQGQVREAITCAANLGRDADTIATMVGALAGAMQGMQGLPPNWTAKLADKTIAQQSRLASELVDTARLKQQRQLLAYRRLDAAR